MDPLSDTADTHDSPVFGAMIGLLTGRGIDSAALQNLERRTTASARHSLWEGPDARDDDESIEHALLPRRLRH